MNSPPRPVASGLPGRLEQEKVLYDFDEAWQRPTPPRIEDFLPAVPLVNPAERRACLEELVKIDLERRWRSKSGSQDAGLGLQPRLENYVARYPELGLLERLPVGLVAEEYRIRHYWGDRPSHDEYRRRFASQVPQMLALLARIDQQLARESIKKAPPVSALKPMDAIRATAEPQAVAPPGSVGDLVDAIRQGQLLTAAQLQEVTTQLASRFTEPHALARELLQRDWLTPYQVNQLMLGRGHELVIGPYVVLQRLGEGGSAMVFKARHRRMEREVALKLVRKDLLEDTEVVGRFKREIQVISRLSHANVVHAFDSGPIGDGLFLAMEYVEGVDLGRLIRQIGPLPVAVACEYLRQAALGLQHAHEHGLIHRDIKPNNLLVSPKSKVPSPESKVESPKPNAADFGLGTLDFGLVKIVDLGLARLCRKVNDEITAPLTPGAKTNVLTPQGALLQGTPDYMAPEQALDFHAADARSDVYSLGCTLFYLLTGQPPFPGGTPLQKLLKHQQAEPPAVEHMRPGLPPAVAGVLRKMLAKQPADRYQTSQEVAEALGDAIKSVPPPTATELEQISRNLRPTSERAQIIPFAVPVERRGPLITVAASAWRGLRQGVAAIVRYGARHPRLTIAVGTGLIIAWLVWLLFFSGPSSLDALNAKDIPASEATLGKETVAVIGLRDSKKVMTLAFRPDGRQVALAREQQVNMDVKLGVVTLWDPGTRQETTLTEMWGVSSMAYSPDGKRLVVAGFGIQANLGPCVMMWEWISKDERKSSTLLPPAGRDIVGVTFSPDGSLFAYHEVPWNNLETKVHVWDVAKNQVVASVPTGAPPTGSVQRVGQVAHMSFSPDGKKLTMALVRPGNNPPIWKQWDISASKEPASLTQPWATVQAPQAVAFAPRGKGLATVVDSTVFLWDDATQSRWSTNLLHQRAVNGLAFNPDGKSLLTWDHLSAYHAGKQAVIIRWAVATGQKLSETTLPRNPGFIIPAHDGVHVAALEGGKVYILRLTLPAARP